ncbi:MAG: hypothetical protein HY878_03945 [Deltaproteobacteria bacterium]|nr:hypothetical protein [Deltaproteobacteria bacterium]
MLVSLLIATVAGCGGKVILSDDAVRIRKIYDFVHELKGLYEQRDEHILSMFSQEYLGDAKEIRGAILKDIDRFNSISLNIFIDRIETNQGNIDISIQWTGIWKDINKTYREGGSMVLLASYGDTIQITGIRGDSPFGVSCLLKTHED